MERKIEPAMVEWLDNKLKENGLAQLSIVNKNARLVMRLAAQSCVGIREEGGNNRGPLVKLIQDTVGGPDPLAWCMSFVQTCIAYAEVKTGVVSPLIATEGCLDLWNNTPSDQKVNKIPAPGAIVIWGYMSLKNKGWFLNGNGHTGILEEFGTERMLLFEGNTESGLNPTGTIERDGGGVYFTDRSIVGSQKMKLLGFIKPF